MRISDWSSDVCSSDLIAAAAAIASPAGGLIALWCRPTTMFMSTAIGYAGGVLLATIGFEMLPQALEMGSLPIVVGGFASGFLAVYAFDLFVYRGKLAGEKADEHPRVRSEEHTSELQSLMSTSYAVF